MVRQLPFRAHITESPPKASPEGDAYMRVLRTAMHPDKASYESLMEAARYPSELVVLFLVANYERLATKGLDDQVKGNPSKAILSADLCEALVLNALAQAKAEGVVWTPAIDELVDRGLWSQAHLQSLETTRGNEEVPEPIALAESLEDWIREQEDVTSLFPLLEFRSQAIHKLVATHASHVDSPLIKHIAQNTPWAFPALAANPNLDPLARDELAFECWKFAGVVHAKRDRSSPFDPPGMEHAMSAIEVLAKHPEGLSLIFKEVFLNEQARLPPEERLGRIAVLFLDDPTLTDDQFARIADLMCNFEAAHVLVDPRCTEVQQLEILERTQHISSQIASLVINNPKATDSLLRKIKTHCNMSQLPPATVGAFVQHPNCSEELENEVFSETVVPNLNLSLYFLDSPKYASSTRHRMMLLESRHCWVLEKLFVTASPEEFTSVALALSNRFPRRACELFNDEESLKGKKFRAEDLAPLLSHEDNEVRLAAIGLLSRCEPDSHTELIASREEAPKEGPRRTKRH